MIPQKIRKTFFRMNGKIDTMPTMHSANAILCIICIIEYNSVPKYSLMAGSCFNPRKKTPINAKTAN